MTSGVNIPQTANDPFGPVTISGETLRALVAIAEGYPVYEFRPMAEHARGTVLRYADGAWLPDDGEYDIAFVSYGLGAPLGLYVHLPYQKNIIWSGLTTHWSGHVAGHPGGNPWHYMLRSGATGWGGLWDRDRHPNERAGHEAMRKCAAINGCANGRGPRFEIGDPYVERGLLRERDTRVVVEPPRVLTCMYCGDGWRSALAKAETPTPHPGNTGKAVAS